MTAVQDICKINLVESKTLPMFAVPNIRKSVVSTDFTKNRFYKAGFLFEASSGDRFCECLATFRKSLASFVIHIPQIFSSEMPNTPKNLSQTHEVCSVSTSAPRQRATTVRKSRTVKSPATDVKRPITPLYQITMNLVVSYSEMTGRVRTCSVIHTDIYQATNENEALGLALSTVRAKYGHYHYIDLQSVKRERTYHINNL